MTQDMLLSEVSIVVGIVVYVMIVGGHLMIGPERCFITQGSALGHGY